MPTAAGGWMDDDVVEHERQQVSALLHVGVGPPSLDVALRHAPRTIRVVEQAPQGSAVRLRVGLYRLQRRRGDALRRPLPRGLAQTHPASATSERYVEEFGLSDARTLAATNNGLTLEVDVFDRAETIELLGRRRRKGGHASPCRANAAEPCTIDRATTPEAVHGAPLRPYMTNWRVRPRSHEQLPRPV
jgi:hypothetical protein